MTAPRPIRKLLVANRGEIALRVIRAAHEMGIETVAVYSDADRMELHVRGAHEAVRLGPPPPKDSYLSIDAILAAAKAHGRRRRSTPATASSPRTRGSARPATPRASRSSGPPPPPCDAWATR